MGIHKISMLVVVESWMLGCLITMVSLVYMILNIRLRNTRLIKMSSPNLNILIASGGFLSGIACTLFSADYFISNQKNQLSNICQLRTALLCCSFSLHYGPLLAKCWRVYRIFEQASLKRVVIKDTRLYIFITGLLVSDVIIISVWLALDPLKYTHIARISQIVPENGLNLSEISVITVQTCTSNYIVTWFTILIASKSPVLIAGLVLSWKTRDVMLPSMNDSCGIIVSTLTTIIVSATVLSIGNIYSESPDAVYSLLLFGIGICSLVTTSMVFVPKFMLWWKNPEKAALRVSVSSKSTHNVTDISTGDQLDGDMYDVLSENRTMKKCLQEKDVAINDLQIYLNNAQSKLMELTMEQETRQDSGLDIDLSSSSGQDDSDANTSGLISKQKSRENNSMSPTPAISAKRVVIEQETTYQPSLKSYNSSSSVVGYAKLCRLRDSIADEITLARNLSTNIRSSISRDIEKVDTVSRRYDSLKSRHGLAGSIAQSYKLAECGDTYDYVSHCVTSSSNFELPPLHKIQFSSSESIDTLPNDKLYPENQRRKKQRRHGRRSSDLNKTVYTIPTEHRIANSAVTLAKSLDTDTFV